VVKYKNRLYQFLTAVTVLALLWCGYSTWRRALKVFPKAVCPKGEKTLLLLGGIVLLVGTWQVLFAAIDRMSRRRRMVCAACLFAVMIAVYVGMISVLHIVPRNDSHSLLDQALYMARTGTNMIHPDSVYVTYFSKYGNNYLLTLFFVWFFRGMDALGVTDLYRAVYILNAACLVVGCIFSCLIARRLRGGAAAVKVLVLFVCNPVYYIMTFWVYSNTLSVPFAMILFYLGVCLYQIENPKQKLLLGCIGAVVTVLGYQIRPTAIFPVLAFLVGWFFYVMPKLRHRPWNIKKLAPRMAAFVLMAAIAAGTQIIVSDRCQQAFGSVSHANYPLTHWLMMGSHGKGVYNEADDKFTLTLPDDKKGPVTREKTIQNYRNLGIKGTAKLWLKKTATTWGDGWFQMSRRLNQMEGYSWVYQHLIGGRSFAIKYYSQCFWLSILLMTVWNLLRQLGRRTVLTYDFLLMTVILGGIVFYLFWEVKSAYAISFLPFFFLLAGGHTLPVPEQKQRRLAARIGLCAVWAAVLVGSGNVQRAAAARSQTPKYVIRSYGSTWIEPVSLFDGETVTQTFYPNHSFDTIRLKIRTQAGVLGASQETADFAVQLRNAAGQVVYETTITPDRIENESNVYLDTGVQQADKNGYTLSITKHAGSAQDMSLWTSSGMSLDSYTGTMTIGDMEKQTDLYMSVYRK
jgi:hypothetical protein